jgi:hypothetical protein
MGGFCKVSELCSDCLSSNGVSKASKSNGVMSEYDENERRRGRSPRKRHLHIIILRVAVVQDSSNILNHSQWAGEVYGRLP